MKNRVRSQSSYVATIQKTGAGVYTVIEYRNETGRGRAEFGGTVGAIGAPAVALIFHPAHLEEFNMTCEGITNWHGAKHLAIALSAAYGLADGSNGIGS